MLLKYIPLALICYCISGFSQEKISLVYTGNMGVYLSNKESSVLIDGLHTRYGDDYLFPSAKIIDTLLTQLQPDAILFTHYHRDHFSASLAADYLTTNTKAVLLGPNQVTREIKKFKDRTFSIATNNYIKQTIKVKDLKITGVKIDHAGKRHFSVENVGYIINFKTKNILHIGDTNWMEDIRLFDQLDLSKEKIDIAILPYWMLLQTDASQLIKKHMNPKQVIATHISPRIKQQELQDIKKQYPEIHFLTTLEEKLHL